MIINGLPLYVLTALVQQIPHLPILNLVSPVVPTMYVIMPISRVSPNVIYTVVFYRINPSWT